MIGIKDKILILDFGSQYTELIARKIRELNVYSEVHSFDTKLDQFEEEFKQGQIKGLILSGGPNSIYDEEALFCDERFLELNSSHQIPILGICYGMQLLAHKEGGCVEKSSQREYGKSELNILKTKLFENITDAKFSVWMSHCDKVTELPVGFNIIANTANAPVAAMANEERNIYGLQFHPEVSHSENGKQILENFVINICKCSSSWNMHNFIDKEVDEIRQIVGSQKVLLALSGGVDSSTLAFLLKKAIGDQLICMFIDHGFMRRNEPEELEKIFNEKFGINVIHINAKERFFNKIKGISDPEKKRKLIGNEFIRVFEEESQKLGEQENIQFLAQGTLYPDIIESSGLRIDPKTGKRIAATIKSHHNVGGLPEDMKFKLIEPLRNLFKDEVRALAKELGLPDEIVRRHPFPGPGLAIRVLGEVTDQKLEIVAHSDLIMREELDAAGHYDSVWQILTALLPVKSVGVMGDKRTYAHPIVIRAVTSEDAMTADWARLPYDLLAKISNRIVNEVPGVNRVVYDITSKPPGTIEWE